MSGDELAILWADWNLGRDVDVAPVGDELAILWVQLNPSQLYAGRGLTPAVGRHTPLEEPSRGVIRIALR